MAREQASTVRHFLKTQVLRFDYVIVDEMPALRTRLPYEQKLERMHDLCIRSGYRDSGECETIRRRLYTEENNAGRPANLLLIESYLPGCIVQASEQDETLSIRRMRDVEREARNLPCKSNNLQSSQLVWRADSYLMCLPLEIHFLLIEHDGALLAA